MIKLQSSLNAFDPTKKKDVWKVIISTGRDKRVVFESAFSAIELEEKYPNANAIIKIKKRIEV